MTMLENHNIQVLKTAGLCALSAIVTWEYIGHVKAKYYSTTIIKPSNIINKITDVSSKLFFNLGKLTSDVCKSIYNIGNIGHYFKCFVVDSYEVTKNLFCPTFQLLASPINYLKGVFDIFTIIEKNIAAIFFGVFFGSLLNNDLVVLFLIYAIMFGFALGLDIIKVYF